MVHLERCSACGLVFVRNPGDTWAFTVIGDRLPIAGMIVLIYFGVVHSHPVLGSVLMTAFSILLLWTAPNRWGVGIALHYLSRLDRPIRGSRSAAVYALTRICPVAYTYGVASVFEIIAEPNRRAILSLLVLAEQSVGEIERELGMPQPTVSKHLRVLREAGFVESTVDAQRRLYWLKPEPLQEVEAWLAPFRRFWSAHVDALERHLDCVDRSTRMKKKPRRRR